MNKNYDEAIKLAERIEMASDYAWIDPYRATTHNKGVMNGIDAVVLATGNDWRAIEAGAHAYAVKDGQYRSLTKWQVNYQDKSLEGTIRIPLQVATVGGTLSSHPTAKLALSLLDITSATDLSDIIASVGLVQNFAALRALVSEGIQKGHMRMQARALAMQIGATIEEIPEVVAQLNIAPQMNRDTARKILNKVRN